MIHKLKADLRTLEWTEDGNDMSEHTPTPWVIPAGEPNGFIICSGDDPKKPGPILMCIRLPLGRRSLITDSDLNANAAFIVKAVNAHDKLVTLLEWLDRKGGLGLDVHDRIRAALASIKEPA